MEEEEDSNVYLCHGTSRALGHEHATNQTEVLEEMTERNVFEMHGDRTIRIYIELLGHTNSKSKMRHLLHRFATIFQFELLTILTCVIIMWGRSQPPRQCSGKKWEVLKALSNYASDSKLVLDCKLELSELARTKELELGQLRGIKGNEIL